MSEPRIVRAKCYLCSVYSPEAVKYEGEWYCPDCLQRALDKDIDKADAERFKAQTQDFLDAAKFGKIFD